VHAGVLGTWGLGYLVDEAQVAKSQVTKTPSA
jgi:hypothetical protein